MTVSRVVLQVPPRPPSDDVPYRGFPNPESSSQGVKALSVSMLAFDFQNGSLSQLGPIPGLPAREPFRMQAVSTPIASGSPPLRVPVGRVAGGGGFKQMGWIAARWIVTMVGAYMARPQRPLQSYLKGETMGTYLEPGRPSNIEDSIAVPVSRALPQPAIARLVNIQPEAGDQFRTILLMHREAPTRGVTAPGCLKQSRGYLYA